MSQACEQLDLAGEALGAERRADLRTKHLERHLSLVLQVLGEIHGRHPARANLALDRVPLGERVAQRFGNDARGGHGRTMPSETSNVNEASQRRRARNSEERGIQRPSEFRALRNSAPVGCYGW